MSSTTQGANLMDPNPPNPSVETLLHAFLPHKCIDHTHANAVLALTDQPPARRSAGRHMAKDGNRPLYVMPGFALAKKTLELFRLDPKYLP